MWVLVLLTISGSIGRNRSRRGVTWIIAIAYDLVRFDVVTRAVQTQMSTSQATSAVRAERSSTKMSIHQACGTIKEPEARYVSPASIHLARVQHVKRAQYAEIHIVRKNSVRVKWCL